MELWPVFNAFRVHKVTETLSFIESSNSTPTKHESAIGAFKKMIETDFAFFPMTYWHS